MMQYLSIRCWGILIFAATLMMTYYSLHKKNWSNSIYDQPAEVHHLIELNDANVSQEVLLSDLEMLRIKTKYHCGVEKVGNCFKVEEDEKTEKVTYPNMTIEWCLAYCTSKSQLHYAGLMDGDVCLCTAKSLIYKQTVNDACMTPCAGDPSATCGSKHEASLYRITFPCIKGLMVPNDFHETHRYGCYQSKPHLLPSTKFKNININSTLCILYCGMQKQPMAFVEEGMRCSCGRLSKELSETRKLASCVEDHIQAYNTLVEDTRCADIRLLPTGNYPKVVLISEPGSGNTWVRYLLEKATGVYTGSKYKDKSVNKMGFVGEIRKNQAVVIKDHMKYIDNMHKYNFAILVIRNPYDAQIADFNRRMSHSPTGHTDEDDFKSKKFLKHIVRHQESWEHIVKYVINSKKPFLLVYFDDLVKNPIAETKRMVEFIIEHTKLKVDDLDQRLMCLTQYTAGRAKRKSKKLTFDPFTDEMKLDLNGQIKHVRQMLLNYGFNRTLPIYERELKL